MKVLFPQCMDCNFGMTCYEKGFERCAKIEAAGKGLGVPVKAPDTSWATDMPFGVFMGLKHIVKKVREEEKNGKSI